MNLQHLHWNGTHLPVPLSHISVNSLHPRTAPAAIPPPQYPRHLLASIPARCWPLRRQAVCLNLQHLCAHIALCVSLFILYAAVIIETIVS